MAQSGFANTTAMQQHPGVMAGHAMGPGHHENPVQSGVVPQPGQNIQPGMHPGVSGPSGGQVSQGGPTGSMTHGGGPSVHALSHLNPSQAQIFQQQQHQIHQQQQQACK
jgi:hypothetical protein